MAIACSPFVSGGSAGAGSVRGLAGDRSAECFQVRQEEANQPHSGPKVRVEWLMAPLRFDGENWFDRPSQQALAGLAYRTEGLDGDIVEIGSWQGRSTIALAEAVEPAVVHAVDTWRGSEGEITELLAAERDIYAEFCANTEGLNIEAHRMDWRDYFETHRNRCRLVFIDGLHTYEEVRDQLAVVVPLMVPGGIVCGDDVHHPPVQQAVIEVFPDAGVVTTLWWARC